MRTKIVGKRYALNPIEDRADAFFAQDTTSVNDEFVYLRAWQAAKQPDLHHLFTRRADQLKLLSHPHLVPVTDYGFDGNYYFAAYEFMSGRKLEVLLERLSPEQSLQILNEVCDALSYLHSNAVPHGAVALESIQLDPTGECPIYMLDTGIGWLKSILLGECKSNESQIADDIIQFRILAAQLVTRKHEPTDDDLVAELQHGPQALYEWFLRLFGAEGYAPYSDINEIRRDLLVARESTIPKNVFYLKLTHSVTKTLYQQGFIPQEQEYLSREFLNAELDSSQVVGQAEPDDSPEEDYAYALTSARFRLICRVDRSGLLTHLVVVQLRVPSPTALVSDRELGLVLNHKVRVSRPNENLSEEDIRPVLDELIEHRLASETRKNIELAAKGSLEIWTKILELQRRLLNEFSLSYEDWETVDDGAAIVVKLSEEVEGLSISISGEERLAMTADQRRQLPIGYFESLQDGEDGHLLKIGLAANVDLDAFQKSGRITYDQTQTEIVLRRQEDGFRRLRFGETVNPKLTAYLTRKEPIVPERTTQVEFWDNHLDKSQKEAVAKALGSNGVFLLQGPPGTGKTRTIVELVRQILDNVDQNARILIASQSNVAVNNALATLLEAAPALQDFTVRVGKEDKADSLSDFLVDKQLKRWADEVRTRCEQYLQSKQRELNVSQDTLTCLDLIQEMRKHQEEIETLKQQLATDTAQFRELEGQRKRLEGLLAELAPIQRRFAVLAEAHHTIPGDLQEILSAFQTEYLGWGESFIQKLEADLTSSQLRTELRKRIERNETNVQELETQISSGCQLVRETLFKLYNVDFQEIAAQEAFINNELKAHTKEANKLAQLKRIAEDWMKIVGKDTEDFTAPYLSRCKVVGATCMGIASKRDIGNVTFDWVIVDEAGRATHPELLVPLVRGRNIVLVGDHRQLPPIIDQQLQDKVLEDLEITRPQLESTLFQELIEAPENTAKVMLKTQYRMHPAIGNLVSNCFYDGELESAVREDDRAHGLSSITSPIVWYSTENLKERVETRVGSSFQNTAEMKYILQLLNEIHQSIAPDTPKSVGIITGYLAQKQLLDSRITQQKPQWNLFRNIEVNTVDAYQGREMDYIIYSITRSNKDGTIGFLRDTRRLNVALSRARELLIIVGDMKTVEYARTGRFDNPFYTVAQHIRTTLPNAVVTL